MDEREFGEVPDEPKKPAGEVLEGILLPGLTITPLEVLMVIRGLDDEGQVTHQWIATDGLTSIEALGMAEWTAHRIKRSLDRMLDDD